MNMLFRLLLAAIAVMLVGCASKPLTHNYSGDVYVRTLQVTLAPVRDPDQNLSEDFSSVTKVLKGLQEVQDMFDPAQQEALVKQLHTFESTLVEGIAERADIPLQYAQDSEVSMQYGDYNELVNIEYDYPLVDAAYVNLFVTIYYTERSDLAVGMTEYNENHIELLPEIILQIDGYNRQGDLFWRQTTRHESKTPYNFGDKYLLGVPTDRLKDADIFLVPMAKGAIENLKINR